MTRAARRAGAMDRPGPAKIHAAPVPTLGGLAVVAGVLGTLAAFELSGAAIVSRACLTALTLAAVPVVAVGVLDDVRGVGAGPRLAAHGLAGTVLYAFGFGVDAVTNPFGDAWVLGAFALPLTLAWVVALVNAMNLVDGLDGLAAGVAGVAAVTLARVGALQDGPDVYGMGLVVGAAALAFLPYNSPRARVFLGDVGATFLGLVLATLALLQNRKATTTLTLLVPILALGLPVLDTAFAVARRSLRGLSPARRDLDHLHHRLLRLGLKPTRAVALLLAATAVLGELAFRMAGWSKERALLATASLGLLAVGGLARLLWLERRNLREERATDSDALQKA